MRLSTFYTAVATGLIGVLSLFATPKAEAAECPSAPPQTALRGVPTFIVSEASGFAGGAWYYAITSANNVNVVNPTTSFLPAAIKQTRTGPLYGFLGGSNVTAYTSFFVLPDANPSQGRIIVSIYDILGRQICQGGFDLTVL